MAKAGVAKEMVEFGRQCLETVFDANIVGSNITKAERKQYVKAYDIYLLKRKYLIEFLATKTPQMATNRKGFYKDGEHLMTPLKPTHAYMDSGEVRVMFWGLNLRVDHAVHNLFIDDRELATSSSTSDVGHYCGKAQCMTHIVIEERKVTRERYATCLAKKGSVDGCEHEPMCIRWKPKPFDGPVPPKFKSKSKLRLRTMGFVDLYLISHSSLNLFRGRRSSVESESAKAR